MTREYARLFSIIMLNNRIGFLWYLIFPLAAFFVYNYNWLVSKPDLHSFYFHTSIFTSYITFAMSIDVTTSLIGMRENGFLKMFKFVSGTKYPIIFGKILSQQVFIITAILIFSFVISLFVLQDYKGILYFVISSIISSLCGAIPITFFFLSLMLFSIKQDSLFAVINILMFVFLVLTATNFSHSVSWGILLLYLNPLELARGINLMITGLLSGETFNNFGLEAVIGGVGIYLVIGLISMKFTRYVSFTNRT